MSVCYSEISGLSNSSHKFPVHSLFSSRDRLFIHTRLHQLLMESRVTPTTRLNPNSAPISTCTQFFSCRTVSEAQLPSLVIRPTPFNSSWCTSPNSTNGPVILYTDIPYVSKIVRIVGHVAVTNYARTKIYELRAWPYIATNNGVWILEGLKDVTRPILFGKPQKFLPVSIPEEAAELWDDVLEEEAVKWHRKIHLVSLLLHSCHFLKFFRSY